MHAFLVMLAFGAAPASVSASEGAVASLVSADIEDVYVISRPAQYDYVPDVIYDRDAYHLYWCGSVPAAPGDHILHAVSSNVTGPFHAAESSVPGTYDIVLSPTRAADDFDGEHTCDPSVIKVGPIYYLYYDGAALGAAGNATAIGVAQSSDGLHFSRLVGGHPIVGPANTAPKPASRYGAGQPAVFRKDGLFYLSVTDTTGRGANAANGAGQFLLRSADPTFQSGDEEFTQTGWMPRSAGRHTASFAYLDAFSVDIAFDERTGWLFVASDQVQTATWIYFLDSTTFASAGHVSLPGTWRDGPSIAKNADRTALRRDTCEAVTFSVFKGDRPNSSLPDDPASWDISLSQGIVRLGRQLCPRR